MAKPTWGESWSILRGTMHGYDLCTDIYEREVLWFIFRRTHFYQKEWEAISLNQFKHGILSADGEVVIGPIDMSEPTLLKCLKHLKGKGLIEVREVPGHSSANEYRIRPESEVNSELVDRYLRRHQPELEERINQRFAKSRGMRRVLRHAPTPTGLGGVPQQDGEGYPNRIGYKQDTETNKDQNSNPAAEGGVRTGSNLRVQRKININK
ncbi:MULTISPECIES: hypothetical protein [unclassified Bradyrhizobium]|uniref:hypothetical protein n=1 Tax=unclassified Bradyrhizobium TaxID=2631580 RepID=UPI00339B2344